ncbi:hypothetical protein [Namhaeicola litoreus]|uniref:Lipoprotein n=1 Tax=Namhaeicola litoreus TaxID=1052145 RepID=A0ABW3Y0V6_9FLAO
MMVQRIVYALFVFLFVISCKQKTEPTQVEKEGVQEVNSEVDDEVLVMPEVTEEAAEVEKEDLSGMNFLFPLKGKYATQENVFKNQTMQTRLKAIDGLNYDNLIVFWNTETPIEIQNDVVHMSGCKQHDCPSNAYDFFYDKKTDNINVYYFRNNSLRILNEKGIIELPVLFKEEIEVKKSNAKIGNVENNTSVYDINDGKRTKEEIEKVKGFLVNDLIKKDIEILSPNQRNFTYTTFDLNDDGKKEFLIGLQNNFYCGTGGCTYFVTTDKGKLINSFTVSRAPFYVLENKTKGWHDLVVYSGSANRLIQFDGKSYPSNPSSLKDVGELDDYLAEILSLSDTSTTFDF